LKVRQLPVASLSYQQIVKQIVSLRLHATDREIEDLDGLTFSAQLMRTARFGRSLALPPVRRAPCGYETQYLGDLTWLDRGAPALG
jgi:hypothetical protein